MKLKNPLCSTGHGTGMIMPVDLKDRLRHGTVAHPGSGWAKMPRSGGSASVREMARFVRRSGRGGGAKGGTARASMIRAEQAQSRKAIPRPGLLSMASSFISRVKAWAGRRQA